MQFMMYGRRKGAVYSSSAPEPGSSPGLSSIQTRKRTQNTLYGIIHDMRTISGRIDSCCSLLPASAPRPHQRCPSAVRARCGCRSESQRVDRRRNVLTKYPKGEE
jgi:hypothetical protein